MGKFEIRLRAVSLRSGLLVKVLAGEIVVLRHERLLSSEPLDSASNGLAWADTRDS